MDSRLRGNDGWLVQMKTAGAGRPHRSAFAAGQAAAGCAFLASSRFSLRARSDSFESADLSSQLSRPPTCSTERMPFVDTRRRIERPSASDINVTFCRLGRKVRLVLLFA